jgi:hypothetical protein
MWLKNTAGSRMCPVGIAYLAAGLACVFGLLMVFHRLCGEPPVSSQPPPSLGDEAEDWLRLQSRRPRRKLRFVPARRSTGQT